MIDLKKIDVTEIENAMRYAAERATQAVREQAESTLTALRETAIAAEALRGRAVERLIADALTATVQAVTKWDGRRPMVEGAGSGGLLLQLPAIGRPAPAPSTP